MKWNESTNATLRARGIVVATLLIACVTSLAVAQHNSNLVFNGVTTNLTATLIIGNTGTNNSLELYNGASVTITSAVAGTDGAYIGNFDSASNNFAIVDNSSLFVTNAFYVGVSGPHSQMLITNGGFVFNGTGRISGITNSSVIVTGTGSIWTNTAAVRIADGGSGHSLTITDGGRVYAQSFIVGVNGYSDQMIVSDGGQALASSTGSIGSNESATNNSVVVTGSGSAWRMPNLLVIGDHGSRNQLIITNSGTVASIGAILGGSSAGSLTRGNGNLVIVTGSGSAWSNTSFLTLGNLSGSGNRVVVTNGGLVNNTTAIIGNSVTSHSNAVLVTGGGSVWSNSSTLRMGVNGGMGNSLTIEDGGRVFSSGESHVGGRGTNTIATVTGNGSSWTNMGGLVVGFYGNGNQMLISDGGTVYNSGIGYIGADAAAYSNSVTVDGIDSLWHNATTLYVGFPASQNTLVVTNGGRVFSADGRLGANSGPNVSTNNLVIVTGTGSLWTNTGTIAIGFGAGAVGNQLLVRDGGTVQTVTGTIDYGNNSATVSGNDSKWITTGTLTIGSNNGEGNQLTITNGGTVVSSVGTIGSAAALPVSNNLVTVTGTGSLWTNAGTLTVGDKGVANQLIIRDGAAVTTDRTIVGTFAGANSNVVIVTGSGSALTSRTDTVVGSGGSGNRLVVTNGGKVFSLAAATISSIGGAGSDNEALVTGSGSVWSNAFLLRIGIGAGQRNRLVISDGGSVYSGAFILGINSPNNELLIADGGKLYTTGGSGLGVNNATYTNNNARISGDGSLWQIATGGSLLIGNDGAGALGAGNLLVENGGTLEVNSIKVGSNTVGAGVSSSLTNSSGILQFTMAAPTLTRLNGGAFVVTDGTISFRGISTASPLVSGTSFTNVTFLGNNTFRLNNATNATGLSTYTFDSVANTANPSNYQRLALIQNSSWRSTTLGIGTGGELLASNNVGTVSGVVTNLGTIRVVDSVMTWSNQVVVGGRYISDPSTNIFADDVTVTANGALEGGIGDLFDFKKSLFIQSTNRTVFDLIDSTVQFSGGGMHTNAISGIDTGTNGMYGGNFEYGTLRLASTNDSVCFGCGTIPASASNALYVGWLDLTGLTNDIPNVTTLVTSLLFAPTNINLYYASFDTRNDYLGRLTYQLLDCEGNTGGFLMAAIPEPGTSALLLGALAILARGANRKQR